VNTKDTKGTKVRLDMPFVSFVPLVVFVFFVLGAAPAFAQT
jgi:hypothetical protein